MRKTPVDLVMLPAAFEDYGREAPWYLDLETGDVQLVFDDPELEETVESDPSRYLRIEAPPARDDFRVMEEFVAGLPPGEARRDLERVLRRAKPFRNFREALREWPQIREQWFAVCTRRTEERVREWLAENEIEPIPRPPENGV